MGKHSYNYWTLSSLFPNSYFFPRQSEYLAFLVVSFAFERLKPEVSGNAQTLVAAKVTWKPWHGNFWSARFMQNKEEEGPSGKHTSFFFSTSWTPPSCTLITPPRFLERLVGAPSTEILWVTNQSHFLSLPTSPRLGCTQLSAAIDHLLRVVTWLILLIAIVSSHFCRNSTLPLDPGTDFFILIIPFSFHSHRGDTNLCRILVAALRNRDRVGPLEPSSRNNPRTRSQRTAGTSQ